MISFEILGKPLGKARPRVNTYTGVTYTPTKTVNYENFVKLCFIQKYRNFTPLETALKIKITAFFEVPTSYSKKKKRELIGQPCTKKPDIDNVVKIILDSLNKLAYKDDNQIAKLEIEKLYGEQAKVIVELENFFK
jgi:Holliday junction resolvase RusA-like endonuclease